MMEEASYRRRCLVSYPLSRLREWGRDPRALVIVPTGAVEQHGPHLPVGVDSMLGQVWLKLALARVAPEEPVWVAPPITFGKSNEHTGFPGTVSISRESLRELLRAEVEALVELGFRKVALMNTHGGNTSVLRAVLQELEMELPTIRLGLLSFGKKDWGLSEQEATFGFHANLVESSLMLAVAGPHCQMEYAVCHYPASVEDPGKLRPESAPATYSWVSADLSPTGIMGDAASATAEQGRFWLELGANGLAEDIQSWLDRGHG